MLPTLARYRLFANYVAQRSHQASVTRGALFLSSATSTRKSAKSPRTLANEQSENNEPKVESRWRRLKRERREAPPPKHRSTYQFETGITYSIEEALHHVRKSAWAKFDESLELVFRLNVDPRRADHNLRGSFTLPFGTGRADKVAVFVSDLKGHDAQVATNAGAHLVGSDELISEVFETRGKVLKEFSTCIAMSEVVPTLAKKVGRILGPKGLMPSPKMNTVVNTDAALKEMIANVLKGIVMYRVDKYSSMQLNVGKLSFSDEMLIENVINATRAICNIRPQNVKKSYVQKVFLCSSMGPSVKLAVDQLVPRAIRLSEQK